jgi:hypothetical protein
MKSILLIALFSLSLIASDEGNDFYLYGVSYHTNRDYNFHEINPGIGYGHYWKESDVKSVELTVQGSVYSNSYGHFTGIATAGPRIMAGHEKDVYAYLSINCGFTYSVDYYNMIILPSVGIGYKKFNVNFIFIPKGGRREDSSNAIGMFLGYKF